MEISPNPPIGSLGTPGLRAIDLGSFNNSGLAQQNHPSKATQLECEHTKRFEGLLSPPPPRGRFGIVVTDEVREVLAEAALPITLGSLKSLFTGIRRPLQSILLHGPPGTGKTSLASTFARELEMNWIAVDPASVLSKWVGESSKMIKEIFETARNNTPCVIFFDELDALGMARANNDSETDTRASASSGGGRDLLAQLLVEMTSLGNESNPGGHIVIIGATNRLKDVDSALCRRFDRIVHVALPNLKQRIELLRTFLNHDDVVENDDLGLVSRSCLVNKTRSIHALSPHDFEALAVQTRGWSGSNLESLCRAGALAPIRRLVVDSVSDESIDPSQVQLVTIDDFTTAIARGPMNTPSASDLEGLD